MAVGELSGYHRMNPIGVDPLVEDDRHVVYPARRLTVAEDSAGAHPNDLVLAYHRRPRVTSAWSHSVHDEQTYERIVHRIETLTHIYRKKVHLSKGLKS